MSNCTRRNKIKDDGWGEDRRMVMASNLQGESEYNEEDDDGD